jgi:glyoxylase-like metal-dependent hydrolase (beta-lactamase superfamily II)
MIEIVPGIYQMQLPLPYTPVGDMSLGESLSQTNVYCIRGNAGWLLVDSGWNDPKNIEIMKRDLQEIGLDFRDISQIVITHSHLDHFGLSGELQEITGAALSLHQGERRFIEPRGLKAEVILKEMKGWLSRNGTPAHETAKLQRLSEGEMNFISPVFPDVVSFTGKVGSPDTFLSGGEMIDTGFFRFEVIWTPGHSPGHICLYEQTKRILISGDHILARITPEIGLNPFSSLNPLGDYIRSLESLRKLEVEVVLPGHEEYFVDLGARIDELIQHHQRRKEDIVRILKTRPQEVAYKIAMEVPWMPEKGGKAWEELDHWGHRMALMETLAHLNVLREEEKVRTIDRDGFDLYCAV